MDLLDSGSSYSAGMNETDFYIRLCEIPEGAHDVIYQDRRYLLNKSTLLDGKLIKIYAEELGGNGLVSGNYYPSVKEGILRPCEMKEEKVVDFVLRAVIA